MVFCVSVQGPKLPHFPAATLISYICPWNPMKRTALTDLLNSNSSFIVRINNQMYPILLSFYIKFDVYLEANTSKAGYICRPPWTAIIYFLVLGFLQLFYLCSWAALKPLFNILVTLLDLYLSTDNAFLIMLLARKILTFPLFYVWQ